MTITEIRQDSRGRYSVVFDMAETLQSTQAVVADFGLFTGMELTDADYVKLRDAGAPSKTKERASRILGIRAHPRKELIRKLCQKGESEENAEITADWLEDLGLLDDEEYGRAIVRHYASRGYGIYRIRDELFKRGVPGELWDDVLDEIPEQDNTVLELIEKQLHGDLPEDFREKQRVIGFLQRRGFSWDEIKTAFRRYEDEFEENDDEDWESDD